MTIWPDERILRRPQRRRIVSAVERGMSKAQAARGFDVSFSSVKRYVEKANRGESLAPKKKSPGSLRKLDQKANKLLEHDLKESAPLSASRTAVTIIEAVSSGLSVSRSTMCAVP
jgi:transposase